MNKKQSKISKLHSSVSFELYRIASSCLTSFSLRLEKQESGHKRNSLDMYKKKNDFPICHPIAVYPFKSVQNNSIKSMLKLFSGFVARIKNQFFMHKLIVIAIFINSEPKTGNKSSVSSDYSYPVGSLFIQALSGQRCS